MPSRLVIDLDKKVQPLAMLFATRMAERGVPFMFTSTLRTLEEQEALFQIGRRGVPGERPVTWTMKSKHLQGLAFDIAILSDGKPTWNVKVDVNKDGISDYVNAGHIGKSCGLFWGGDFGDLPHFEWRGDRV